MVARVFLKRDASFRSTRATTLPRRLTEIAEAEPSAPIRSRSMSTPRARLKVALASAPCGVAASRACSANRSVWAGSRSATATSFGRRTICGAVVPAAIGSCVARSDPSVFARKSTRRPSGAVVTVEPKVRSAPTHGTFFAWAARLLLKSCWRLP